MTGTKQADDYSHLVILRRTLLRALGYWLALSIPAIFYANKIFDLASNFLLQGRPKSDLLAASITSPFMAPLKCALTLSFVIALPLMLFELYKFIAPGLYKHERRKIWPLIVFSLVMFLIGMSFAFFIVAPWTLGFFYWIAPNSVTVLTDINSYIDFIFALMFSFGVAFQTPLIVMLLIQFGIVDYNTFANMRRYFVVLAFTLGMILTPPDVVSQILLAVPLLLLYELGLLLSRLQARKSQALSSPD